MQMLRQAPLAATFALLLVTSGTAQQSGSAGRPLPTRPPGAQADPQGPLMPGCGARYEEMSRSLNDSLTIIRNAQAQDDPARVHAALGDVDTLLSSLRTALDENRTACAAMMAEMRGMMGRSTTGGHLPATAGTSGQSAGQAPPALLAPLRFTTSLDELKSLCGVEKEDPPSVDYRGQKYYFCNDADRARFEKDPEALLKRR